MLLQRRRSPCLLIAGALAATGACNDHRAPTAPPVAATAAFAAAGGGGNNAKVKVKTLQLSSNSLRVDGPGATATASIGNSGLAIQTGVSIRAEIVQGAATRQAADVPTQCRPGDSPGFLPTGNCEMNVAATASNASGGGTLIPGPAAFELRLFQISGGTSTAFDTKTVAVSLVSPIPTITAITPTSSFIELGASFTSYTATIQNPWQSRSNVGLQGWITQGSARRAAGGTQIVCNGGAPTVLPTGSCTAPSDIVARNEPADGTGTLVPGPATFELELKQSDGTTETILDTKTIPITLVVSTPSIIR